MSLSKTKKICLPWDSIQSRLCLQSFLGPTKPNSRQQIKTLLKEKNRAKRAATISTQQTTQWLALIFNLELTSIGTKTRSKRTCSQDQSWQATQQLHSTNLTCTLSPIAHKSKTSSLIRLPRSMRLKEEALLNARPGLVSLIWSHLRRQWSLPASCQTLSWFSKSRQNSYQKTAR